MSLNRITEFSNLISFIKSWVLCDMAKNVDILLGVLTLR